MVRPMWTDEQLTANGWTAEQIATYHSEQKMLETPAITDNPINQEIMPQITNVSESQTIEESFANLNEPKENLGNFLQKSGGNPIITAILMAALVIIVPFSLYSISSSEGAQGPTGEEGTAGINGTDGSSFHLALSIETLPNCDDSTNDQIFFIASQSMFQVCQNNTWSIVDLTGPSGTDGSNGQDGADGTNGSDGQDGSDGNDGLMGQDGVDGEDGQNGADGTAGNNGLTSLIVTKVEPNGVNCPNSGTLVETGIDDNNDNILSSNEVDSFVFICSGETGQDGTNGSSTMTMMVARLSTAPANLGCNGTGELLEQGMDNGAGNGIALNGILESGEVLSRTLICTSFLVVQVDDINPGAASSIPSNFVTINSTMYFTANDGTTNGIWAYENGTYSQIHVGSVSTMREIGSQLMFTGVTPAGVTDPWVYEPSNGTSWQIAELFPGGTGSIPGEYTLIGTTVYFAAIDSSGIYDLWAYETLNFSVWQVEAEIQPTSLIAVNSDLYFSAGPNNANVELWKHETATNTTFMVKDINPGILSSSPGNFVLIGTTIYMSANDGGSAGTELHAYDVTNNSTWLAADIRPGVATSSLSDLVVLGTQVYFKATSGTHFEMWAYESQNNSFWEITNFQSTSGQGGPSELTVEGDTIYFSANDGTTGEELWAHNSINGTIWQVFDLDPNGGLIGEIHVHNGNVYFAGDDGQEGVELWKKQTYSRHVSFV